MDDKQRAICGEIANHYGAIKQEAQAVSKLTELLYLLTRRANQRGSLYTDCLIDGLADVEIMCEQIRQLYKITLPEISGKIDYKLYRQQRRIEEEGEQNASD